MGKKKAAAIAGGVPERVRPQGQAVSCTGGGTYRARSISKPQLGTSVADPKVPFEETPASEQAGDAREAREIPEPCRTRRSLNNIGLGLEIHVHLDEIGNSPSQLRRNL
jgi:hypothetical protein